jgi:hypothetical protein
MFSHIFIVKSSRKSVSEQIMTTEEHTYGQDMSNEHDVNNDHDMNNEQFANIEQYTTEEVVPNLDPAQQHHEEVLEHHHEQYPLDVGEEHGIETSDQQRQQHISGI